MRFKYFFLSIFVFGIVSCYTNKQLASQLHHLKNSEEVVMEFYKIYGGDDVVYPKIEFNRLKKSKSIIEFKYFNKRFDIENSIYFKPYIALTLNDRILLSEWANKYDNSISGNDLYY